MDLKEVKTTVMQQNYQQNSLVTDKLRPLTQGERGVIRSRQSQYQTVLK